MLMIFCFFFFLSGMITGVVMGFIIFSYIRRAPTQEHHLYEFIKLLIIVLKENKIPWIFANIKTNEVKKTKDFISPCVLKIFQKKLDHMEVGCKFFYEFYDPNTCIIFYYPFLILITFPKAVESLENLNIPFCYAYSEDSIFQTKAFEKLFGIFKDYSTLKKTLIHRQMINVKDSLFIEEQNNKEKFIVPNTKINELVLTNLPICVLFFKRTDRTLCFWTHKIKTIFPDLDLSKGIKFGNVLDELQYKKIIFEELDCSMKKRDMESSVFLDHELVLNCSNGSCIHIKPFNIGIYKCLFFSNGKNFF